MGFKFFGGFCFVVGSVISLAGCGGKFNGKIEVSPELARYISVEECEETGAIINCTIRNLTEDSLAGHANKIYKHCYDGKGVKVVASNWIVEIQGRAAIKEMVCPANYDVRRIAFSLKE